MAPNNNSSAVTAAVCGGATCCILVCLFVIGIPMFIAGIVLVSEFDERDEWGEGPYTAGIICIVIASLMIVAGIITAIFTCVCVGRATEGAAQNQSYTTQGHVIMTSNTQPAGGGYPIVPQQAPPQTFYPAGGQVQSYPQHQQHHVHTGMQYGGNQNPNYVKY